MIKTGHDLDDIGRTLSWGALGAFLHRVDIDSEIAKELDPELAHWAMQAKTNAILADIFDMLAMINANLCAMGSGKKAKKPKSYPRPGNKTVKKLGRGALPPDELRAFFERKRQEHIKKYGR